MLFALPDGRQFEIPDEWWNESGMDSFVRKSSAYTARPLTSDPEHEVSVVPALAVKPVRRDPGVIKDFGGFERERMVRVLKWIAEYEPMEPVQVLLQPDGTFQYSVYDGFHRYHASIAAGFTEIPVAIGKWGFSWDQ